MSDSALEVEYSMTREMIMRKKSRKEEMKPERSTKDQIMKGLQVR